MSIPVIDLFAGPGGLGEGFSALRRGGQSVFKIELSIEKDPVAHKTLELRAFFRQFPDGKAPEAYYDYLAGKMLKEDLFDTHRDETKRAQAEAWNATLGVTDPNEINARIKAALSGNRNWLLIGGPPCQAYSLVGRSRRMHDPTFAKDEKNFLYQQYLRILAEHRPPVFVMENVKGLLSAKVQQEGMFDRIINDLENPTGAVFGPGMKRKKVAYRLVSLVVKNGDLLGRYAPKDFVVNAEKFGIPQARHRIIILGIRTDITVNPGLLEEKPKVTIRDVISDLPALRSGLSKEPDSTEAWAGALSEILDAAWLSGPRVGAELRETIQEQIRKLDVRLHRGTDHLPQTRRKIGKHREWYMDDRLPGVSNHSTRSHIRADLHRYFFVSAFAQVHKRSPLLNDFPAELLPKHGNVEEALKKTKFNDRFRVQVADRPSTTVTSHISKDGHYYIHYDPKQCRSLTVREAARLQTFPDNYFFEGPRTQQYHQVGNAVPPLLAHQIAKIVADLF